MRCTPPMCPIAGKVVMAYGIAFFSLASALLPALAISPLTLSLGLTLPAVLASRVLVGFGEGVALPCMNNLIATHVPAATRATALGTAFTGFHSGNLVGLVLSPMLLAAYGWRAVFYTFSVIGAPLLALWLAVVPPQPKPVETDAVGGTKPAAVSIRQLLSSRAVWAIIVVKFVNHWGYFIYLNWMPSYFYKVLGGYSTCLCLC
jgi:predicted MFS family arabinose efflux permease